MLKGGTCLHKLWLPEPWRYSKDLDYARTEDTPMGPVFDALRAAGQRVGLDNTKTRVLAQPADLRLCNFAPAPTAPWGVQGSGTPGSQEARGRPKGSSSCQVDRNDSAA